MDHADLELESWIDEQVGVYLAASRAERPPTPEQFVGALATPMRGERGRARLLARLRVGLDVERRLAGDDAPADRIGVGVELDDFVIEGPLGQGGMGQVFRARQKSLGRSVAIKTPYWLGALDARERARFAREAQAVARLRHPSVVPLFQLGEHRGAPFLVMELVHGETLAQIVRELRAGKRARETERFGRGETSYERAVASVVLDAAQGIDAAHGEGVVHRDLKPSNLMLDAGGALRILDFGLARWHDADAITHSRDLIGTPEYLAPELVHNPRASTPASDVYALGVVLYELLAPELPFRGDSPAAVLARILEGDATPLHVRRSAPRALSAIVEKAMARDLTRRYASAAELARDLRAFLDGREVSARPSSVLTRFGRRLQRRPALTAASVVAVVAVVASAVAWTQWRVRDVLQAAADRRESRQLLRDALLDEQMDSSRTGAGAARSDGKESAVKKLVDALERDPTYDEARCHLTAVLINLGREPEALPHLEHLERTFAEHEVVRWMRDQVETDDWSRLAPPEEFASRWQRASDVDRLYALRAWHKVADGKQRSTEISATLRDHPEYGPTVLHFEAVALTVQLPEGVQPDHVSAARLYQAALVSAPDHPVLAANLGTVLVNLHRARHGHAVRPSKEGRAALSIELRDGLRWCERALERHTDYDHLWTTYAALLGVAGELDLAIEKLRPQVHRFADNTTLAQNWLSTIATKIEHDLPVQRDLLDEALEVATVAMRRDEKNPTWPLLAAWMLRGLNDVGGVTQRLQQFVELGGDPAFADVRTLSEWTELQAKR